MKFQLKTAALTLSLFACAFSVQGDDEITKTIQEGLEKYKSGEISGAGSSLQYALSLLNEKKAEKILATLPQSIDGWEGDKGKSNSLGILGGGVNIKRTYKKENKRANISIMMDSPLVQQMIGMLSNPMFAGQMGAKMRTVEGEKASFNPENGELTMVINNTILIQVKAKGSEEEDVMAITKAINIAELKALK